MKAKCSKMLQTLWLYSTNCTVSSSAKTFLRYQHSTVECGGTLRFSHLRKYIWQQWSSNFYSSTLSLLCIQYENVFGGILFRIRYFGSLGDSAGIFDFNKYINLQSAKVVKRTDCVKRLIEDRGPCGLISQASGPSGSWYVSADSFLDLWNLGLPVLY